MIDRAYILLILLVGFPGGIAYGLVVVMLAWVHPRGAGVGGAWGWGMRKALAPLVAMVDGMRSIRGEGDE